MSRRAAHVAFRSLCGALALVVAFSIQASAQQGVDKQKAQSGVRWDEDSIRFGDSLRIELRPFGERGASMP